MPPPISSPQLLLDITERERLHNQLVGRGWATYQEIFALEFGQWPLKGLDIDGTAKDLTFRYAELPETDIALGTAGQGRVSLRPDIKDQSLHVAGHEVTHVMQTHPRNQLIDPSSSSSIVPDQIGGWGVGRDMDRIMTEAETPAQTEARRKAYGDYLVKSILSNQPLQSASPNYLSQEVEIQARMHTLMATGYRRWKELPNTREGLWAAMSSQGIPMPEGIRRELESTPQGKEALQKFPLIGGVTPEAEQIYAGIKQLPAAQQEKVWREVFPKLYAGQIEFYGDKPGRERFQLGKSPSAERALYGAIIRCDKNFDYASAMKGINPEVTGDFAHLAIINKNYGALEALAAHSPTYLKHWTMKGAPGGNDPAMLISTVTETGDQRAFSILSKHGVIDVNSPSEPHPTTVPHEPISEKPGPPVLRDQTEVSVRPGRGAHAPALIQGVISIAEGNPKGVVDLAAVTAAQKGLTYTGQQTLSAVERRMAEKGWQILAARTGSLRGFVPGAVGGVITLGFTVAECKAAYLASQEKDRALADRSMSAYDKANVVRQSDQTISSARGNVAVTGTYFIPGIGVPLGLSLSGLKAIDGWFDRRRLALISESRMDRLLRSPERDKIDERLKEAQERAQRYYAVGSDNREDYRPNTDALLGEMFFWNEARRRYDQLKETCRKANQSLPAPDPGDPDRSVRNDDVMDHPLSEREARRWAAEDKKRTPEQREQRQQQIEARRQKKEAMYAERYKQMQAEKPARDELDRLELEGKARTFPASLSPFERSRLERLEREKLERDRAAEQPAPVITFTPKQQERNSYRGIDSNGHRTSPVPSKTVAPPQVTQSPPQARQRDKAA